MGSKMDPDWLFNASPGPPNSQHYLLSHIVGNIWKTGCSLFFLVIHISALWRGFHSLILDTYKYILQNGLPGQPKDECYILNVYLYLFWVHWYKTRIDGTINCILVYKVTAVTYKLRGDDDIWPLFAQIHMKSWPKSKVGQGSLIWSLFAPIHMQNWSKLGQVGVGSNICSKSLI